MAAVDQTKKMCPDCREEMVGGFILDVTLGGTLVQRWLKGGPEKSKWTGVLKMRGKECRTVETYRCPKCGLLRSFATTEVDPL